MSALLVACLAYLLEPLWRPIEEVYITALSHAAVSMSADDSGEMAGIAIVKISRDRFDSAPSNPVQNESPAARICENLTTCASETASRGAMHFYRGRSPLNRCAIAEDLRNALSDPQRIVAVDLDLSPVIAPDDVEEGCQCELDRLIDSNRHRLVLMAPGEADHLWEDARAALCPLFGDAGLEISHGMARGVVPTASRPSFGYLMAAQLQVGVTEGETPNHRCARVADALRVAKYDGRTAEIPFHAVYRLFNRGVALDPRDPILHQCADDPRPRSIKAVVFGAGYSDDDMHLTPVGMLHGVDIHAVIAACRPTPGGHVTHLLLDVLLGTLVFGPLLHKLWAAYFETLSGKRAARELPKPSVFGCTRLGAGWRSLLARTKCWLPRQPGAADLWLLLIAALIALSALGAFVVVTLFQGLVDQVALHTDGRSGCHPIFVPAAVVVGLAIDAGFAEFALARSLAGGGGHGPSHSMSAQSGAVRLPRLRVGLFAVVLVLTFLKLYH